MGYPSPHSHAPSIGSFPITKSDTTVLSPIARRLYVGGAGAVAFRTVNGDLDTWTVPAGGYIDLAIDKVLSTGTTATDIHGLK